MAQYLELNGFRTTDTGLNDVVRFSCLLNLTKNGLPIDQTIEEVYVKIASDLKKTTPPLLEGDTSTGHAEVIENDSSATQIKIKFDIEDMNDIDSGFSNQKYILQIDVKWDDNTIEQIYNNFIQFNPGI